MATFRMVDTRIHNDRKFRELSKGGRLLFLTLITHQLTTIVGAIPLRKDALLLQLPDADSNAFEELLNASLIRYDPAGLVWLPNWFKYNPLKGSKHRAAAENAIDSLPECELRSTVLQHLHDLLSPSDADSGIGYPEKVPKKVSFSLSVSVLKTQIQEIWSYLNRERGKAIPGSRPLSMGNKEGERIADRLKEGRTVAECKAVIDAYAIEAQRRPDTKKWFNGVTPFRPDNFARALANPDVPSQVTPDDIRRRNRQEIENDGR